MKVGIIVGSVREGRVTDRLAKWVANDINKVEGLEAKLIDLKDYPMPIFDEAISPQYNPNRVPVKEVKKWLDALEDCDGFALVTPEYNRSYAPALKNAIDYLDFQFKHKAILIVAHGTTGGAQAVSHLRGVIPGVLGLSVPPAVMVIGRIGDFIDEDGNASEEVKSNPYGPQAALGAAVSELEWLMKALSSTK